LADRLLRSFPDAGSRDVEVFATAVVTILMHYPLDVVEEVCDPYYGLPSKQNWVPTLFEIRKACDAVAIPRQRAAARQAQLEQQLRERGEEERRLLAAPRPTYEEIKADLAKHGIFIGRNGRVQDVLTPEMARQKLGLTQGQWDAIPNAPARKE
jgi:hypothetical protein